MSEHFGYAIDKRYLPVLVPFLLRPARDGVKITDEGSLAATFGIFKISTPLSNITGAHITRNYRWWTAVGVRMSRVDDGLTFGTNRDGGVCIHFGERVPSLLRRSGHSALTVTVADLEGLTTALGGNDRNPSGDHKPINEHVELSIIHPAPERRPGAWPPREPFGGCARSRRG